MTCTFANASQKSGHKEQPHAVACCQRSQHGEERPYPHTNLQHMFGQIAVCKVASCRVQAHVSACMGVALTATVKLI